MKSRSVQIDGKIISLASVALSFVGSLAAALNFYYFAVLTLVFCYLTLFVSARRVTGNISNLLMTFIFFSYFYSFSAPVTILSGEELHVIFEKPYLLDEVMILLFLASAGIGVAMFLRNQNPDFSFCRESKDESIISAQRNNALIRSAIIFALLSSIFEIINVQRAGGVQIIFLGKAFYQGAIANLTFYIPTHFFAILSAAFLGFELSVRRKDRLKRLVPVFISILPWLLIMLISGRRGVLIAISLVLFMAYYYRMPLKRISIRAIIILFLLYVGMTALYVGRSQVEQSFVNRDSSHLVERMTDLDVWLKAINPANNEFAAPFGNINTYLLLSKEDPHWGLTYINGLLSAVPGILWENKPVQEIYRFRSKYFPEEEARGSIASTGYSSVLEAYVNFRYFGVFFVYIVIAYILLLLEKYKLYGGVFYGLVYSLMAPFTMSFHRSSLDANFIFSLILALIGMTIFLISKRTPKVKFRINFN